MFPGWGSQWSTPERSSWVRKMSTTFFASFFASRPFARSAASSVSLIESTYSIVSTRAVVALSYTLGTTTFAAFGSELAKRFEFVASFR